MQGVVMEIGNGYAVILNKDGKFVKVINKNYMVGETVTINENHKAMKLISTLAACFIFIVGLTMYVPVSYVSLDVNPGFNMRVNMWDRVISVSPVNDDAKEIVSDYKIKKSDVKTTLQNVIKVIEDKGYNTKNVTITVISQKRNIMSKINDIKNENKDSVITVNEAPKDIVKYAKDKNISYGKAYEEKNDIEDLKEDKKESEIKDSIVKEDYEENENDIDSYDSDDFDDDDKKDEEEEDTDDDNDEDEDDDKDDD